MPNPPINRKYDRDEIREVYTRRKGDAYGTAAEIGCSVRQVHRMTFDLRTRHGSGRISNERLATAKSMLDDRAGYLEVSRTTGIDKAALRRHFPGMGLTPQEAGERAVMALKLNEI